MSKWLSDDDLKKLALWLRQKLGFASTDVLDMMAVLRRMSEVFPTFHWKEVSDEELPHGEGFFDGTQVQFPSRTIAASVRKNPRAVYSIAHELGHWALMHEGQRFRRPERQAYERATPTIVREERHAEKFAAFFIAPDPLVENCDTVEEIMRSGLGRRASEIRKSEVEAYLRIKSGRERELPKNVVDFLQEAERKGHKVTALRREPEPAAKLRARQNIPTNVATKRPAYMNEVCTNCGLPKLQQIDNRYRCDGCKYTFERFQDGDLSDG